ncbi:hypothetical protein NK718_20425 [Alsobacter sp. SYSU M60028]|uniref:Phosphate starvation-inducible protein PsiF n=1 Tax=Alsobacter ponti TaxID=2962936 RepID=A0ABT1LHC1_9HYPH|nr:hypothetical protein [Alsobacter ponti]MCP8940900.1 hypothetical protein [Alsobacter ponti]
MRTILACVLSAAVALGVASPAFAQTATTPAKPAATAPAKPAAAAPSTSTKAPTPAQTAQRNKMKACGSKWQAMKKAGKTQGQTWREFSSDCLKKS